MYYRLSALFILSISLRACLTAPSLGIKQADVQEKLLDKISPSAEQVDEDVEELHSLVKAELGSATTARPVPDVTIPEDKRNAPFADADDTGLDFSESQDTARDMAEYIFWTGDESSVTKAVKDFIKQDLMDEEEALGFLQKVHSFLNQMQQKYGPSKQEGRSSSMQMLTNKFKSAVANENNQSPRGQIVVTNLQPASKIRSNSELNKIATLLVNANKEKKDSAKSRVAENTEKPTADDTIGLEDIIYQLSRILFAQGLHKNGKTKPEESLEKFADFLEKEAKDGRLSPQLQKKVLDLLLTSLLDTMIDQQDVNKKEPFTGKPNPSVALLTKKSN